MRFHTRVFLFSFVPFAALLAFSFLMVQRLVQTAVRDGLRSSLRENHRAVARIYAKSDLQNSRFLKILGENSSLKAGVQLLLSMPRNEEAKATLEDQLRDLCERMGFDLLLVSSSEGQPIAGVLRADSQLIAIDVHRLLPDHEGLLIQEGKVYQVASVPIDRGDENIGSLSVGEYFDFSEFTTPAVLIRNGRVLKSSIPNVPVSEVDASLKQCGDKTECDVRIGSAAYISLPMQNLSLGGGYVLRSFQNIDSANGPVQAALHNVFLSAGAGAVIAAFLFSAASARSIVRPIAAVVSHLQNTERTGLLPDFGGTPSSIREIKDLTASFNRAASSIREGRESLQNAYVEFAGSLASALDARDRYTAGHSERVSELSCATAAAMDLAPEDIETIRVGALLHDIGKIGIADAVLQKPGKLTGEEFAIVKQHPKIGRRILEGVQGFSPYLSAVELHHENWDGTGYPLGHAGNQTPLEARIIHVSDAYDAMTTDRPYRKGMTHERAIQILRSMAGTQFDPEVVDIFACLHSDSALADVPTPEQEQVVL